MAQTLHIVYNDGLDPTVVVGIVYTKRTRRDLGRVQVKKSEWEAFRAAMDDVATFSRGFN